MNPFLPQPAPEPGPCLPVLSIVQRRALAMLDDRRTTAAEIMQLVELDVCLMGTVLRVLRCPLLGNDDGGRTLEESLQVIGRPLLRAMVLALPRVDGRQVREEIERACRYWVHSTATAAAARWLANQEGVGRPEDAYLAGQITDLGWLLARPGDDWNAVGERMRRLVADWHLPPAVAQVTDLRWQMGDGPAATRAPPAMRRIAALVDRGSRIATALGYGTGEGEEETDLPELQLAGLDEAVELELAHAAAILCLPATPGSELERLVTNEELRLGGAEADEFAPDNKTVSRERALCDLAAVHKEMLGARGLASINDVLQASLRAMYEGLSFERVMLLEREPGRRDCVRGRILFEPTRIELNGSSRSLTVPTDPQGAVQRALNTGQPSHGADRALDLRTLTHLGVNSFAAAPIRASAADLGVVVVDHFFSRTPVTDADVQQLGLLCSSLGLVIENTALDAQGRKLRSLAEKDELTGINNRRNLLQLLQREVDRARRYGKPLSVAMIDVDRFKRWNDMHGHQVGDQILQAVAQLISSCSREIDCYGRYGGEEFMVVLPETPLDRAVRYAERVRLTIEEHGAEIAHIYGGNELAVSLGVTALAPRGDDLVALIQRADEALYAAKESGRNRVCVYESGSPPREATEAERSGAVSEM